MSCLDLRALFGQVASRMKECKPGESFSVEVEAWGHWRYESQTFESDLQINIWDGSTHYRGATAEAAWACFSGSVHSAQPVQIPEHVEVLE